MQVDTWWMNPLLFVLQPKSMPEPSISNSFIRERERAAEPESIRGSE